MKSVISAIASVALGLGTLGLVAPATTAAPVTTVAASSSNSACQVESSRACKKAKADLAKAKKAVKKYCKKNHSKKCRACKVRYKKAKAKVEVIVVVTPTPAPNNVNVVVGGDTQYTNVDVDNTVIVTTPPPVVVIVPTPPVVVPPIVTPPPVVVPAPAVLVVSTVNDVVVKNYRYITATGTVAPGHTATVLASAGTGTITVGKEQTVSGTFTINVTYMAGTEVGTDQVTFDIIQSDGQRGSKASNVFAILPAPVHPL